MSISKGDSIPAASFTHMTADGPAAITSDELFAGKKVVLFALPGAFTPTCTAAHLPGFVAQADTIKAKGVDDIICLASNDVFVMDAWGKSQNAEAIHMVADGNADFARAIGLDLDLTSKGMGVRHQRYALIVDDGKVVDVAVEASPADHEVSSAESVLAKL